MSPRFTVVDCLTRDTYYPRSIARSMADLVLIPCENSNVGSLEPYMQTNILYPAGDPEKTRRKKPRRKTAKGRGMSELTKPTRKCPSKKMSAFKKISAIYHHHMACPMPYSLSSPVLSCGKRGSPYRGYNAGFILASLQRGEVLTSGHHEKGVNPSPDSTL